MVNTWLRRIAQVGATLAAILLSLWITLLTQASSPDYRHLFSDVSILVVADILITWFTCFRAARGVLWLVGVPALIAFLAYAEMACRVVVG